MEWNVGVWASMFSAFSMGHPQLREPFHNHEEKYEPNMPVSLITSFISLWVCTKFLHNIIKTHESAFSPRMGTFHSFVSFSYFLSV